MLAEYLRALLERSDIDTGRFEIRAAVRIDAGTLKNVNF